MKEQYDIFISYRRDDGRQYARLVEKELKSQGFRVFLDYEELKDGIFKDIITGAIAQSKIFLMIVTPRYLVRCKDEDDWVRKEILLAVEHHLHFVPLIPDGLVTSIPPEMTESLPAKLMSAVLDPQWSEVNFGHTMQSTFDQMVRERILPYVKPKMGLGKKLMTVMFSVVILVLIATSIAVHLKSVDRLHKKELMVNDFWGIPTNWYKEITLKQLVAVHDIMDKMVPVQGGTCLMGAQEGQECDELLETPQIEVQVPSFYMSKYEVTVAQWCGIMEEKFPSDSSLLPKCGISFNDCVRFVERLADLTGMEFAIPTEAEWEYAARGGHTPDGTLYSGSDDADEVAWYESNSRGKLHECNAQHSPMRCNGLNLYDMSGNVCEWCEWTDSEYRLYSDVLSGTVTGDIVYNDGIRPHRGGSYDGELYQLTVYHRETADSSLGSLNIGLRLIIRL